ncbi:hypothetical protein KSS87_019474 [Heliosperma pusillum]|nr:hypothetical protein KSS87_019474 [Heliosperma pusillum]
MNVTIVQPEEMDTSIIISSDHKNELLKAQTHIWTHLFSFLNSMALKCALQLQIPDAIHKHGKPMTLPELATALALTPTKSTSLYRITRLLVHSNFLSKSKSVSGEQTFDLTVNSKLLLKDHPMTLAPFALALLDPVLTEPAHHLASWFQNNDESPFHTVNGIGVWDYAATEQRFNEYFNKAMASDAKFVGDILLGNSEFNGLFEGVSSLVDVGGGTGTMANAIAKAYPNVKCTVLDLPHVVQGLENNGLNVDYVGGDMFETIPSADVVLLKWILHDWSDDRCLEILKRCKGAIPSKKEGGKLMILDIVLDVENDNLSNIQLLLDMEMLSLNVGGKERIEEEWKKLFLEAGFNDYQIFPILGPRSLIVVYH